MDTGFIEVFLDGVSLHTFCEGCIVPAGDILVEPFSTQFTATTTGPVPFELTFKRRFPNPLDSFPVFHHADGLSITVIPVPPAIFLFGSGLLGLVGIARRKKSA